MTRKLFVFAAVYAALQTSLVDIAVGQEEYIQRLVSKLSSREFVERSAAANELIALGDKALDGLWSVRNHQEVETRVAVRAIIDRIDPRFCSDDDSRVAQQILREYRFEPVRKRSVRIETISRLPLNQNWRPLCKIARYEPSGLLADFAATSLICSDLGFVQRDKLSDVIGDFIRNNDRQSCQLLRRYVVYLQNPSRLRDQFDELVRTRINDAKRELNPASIGRKSTFLLAQWYAERLIEFESVEAGVQIADVLVELVPADELALSELLAWLTRNELWSCIEKVELSHESVIDSKPLLTLQIAEARRCCSEFDQSRNLFEMAALKIIPVEKPILAIRLQKMGLVSLAEWLFLDAVATLPSSSADQIRCRLLISELLSDQQRFVEAAEQMRPVTEFVLSNEKFARVLKDATQRTGSQILAHHQYLLSRSVRDGNNSIDKEFDYLISAIENDPKHSDALIAFYRMAERLPDLKEESDELIALALKDIEASFHRKYQALKLSEDAFLSHSLSRQVARLANRWAWIAANTRRDIDQAIEYSRLANDLQPGTSCYLDTLARSHFAAGHLEQASAVQQEAIVAAPHSFEMKMQGDFYKQMIKAMSVARIFE